MTSSPEETLHQRRFWTVEEDAFLRAHLGTMHQRVIAERLGRSAQAIRSRVHRQGIGVPDRAVTDFAERFGRYVHPAPSGCWEWIGARVNGYGVIAAPRGRRGGPQRYAHRVAYERTNGPIPGGLVVSPRCRNRACVNPDHLDAVTHAEKRRRGMAS